VLLDEPGDPDAARAPYEEALALAVAQRAGWWQHALNVQPRPPGGGRRPPRPRARPVHLRARPRDGRRDELGAAEAMVNLAVAEVELARPADARATLAAGLAGTYELGLRAWALNGLRVGGAARGVRRQP